MSEITLPEAATRYGIPYSSLAQAAREGRIATRRSGRAYLVEPSAIEGALAQGRLQPRGPAVRAVAGGVRCPCHGFQAGAEYAAQDPAPCGCAWVWEAERLVAVPREESD